MAPTAPVVYGLGVRGVRLFVLLMSLTSVSASAYANGRFPTADHLSVMPSDPTRLVMRTTFGVLVSSDAGETFRWICEGALGYSGQVDPSVEFVDDGSIVVGYRRALLRSMDDGCTWEPASGGFEGSDVVDLVTDVNEPQSVLVLAREMVSGRITVTRLGPESVEALTSPGDDFHPATIEVAATDSRRIYVTGLTGSAQSLLLRSLDGGASWERTEIAPHPTEPAYLSAVDPNDANRLYIRIDGETTDALLVSDDGGLGFREVLSLEADLLGFALSPDGQRVAVGGPEVSLWLADTEQLEFRQASSAVKFLTCLRWSPLGLFACAREVEDGWTLARSDDGGDHFQSLFHITDLQPRACAAGSITESRCSVAWQDIAPTLGIELEAEPEPAPESAATSGQDSSCELSRGGDVSTRYGAIWALVLVGLAQRRRCGAQGRPV